MVRILLLFLTFQTLASCVSLSENRQAAELHLQIGMGYMSSGNYPQALAEMIQAEKLDPSNPKIQNSLGMAYFFRDRLDLSELHLRKAVTLKETYSEARNNLGQVLIERGRYQEALKELQITIQDLTYANPERPLTNSGIAKFKMGQFEAAKNDFSRALEVQRENCVAYTYYGRCFYELKDYKRAAEILDRAVGFCQRLQYDEPHYYSGLSYYQLGQGSKAEARLEALIKLYPDGKYVEKAKKALDIMHK